MKLRLRAITFFLISFVIIYIYFQAKGVPTRPSIDTRLPQASREVSTASTDARRSFHDFHEIRSLNRTFRSHNSRNVEKARVTNGRKGVRLHTVTYASHGGKDDRFCRGVESSIRNGHALVVLGWGSKWRGLSQKLEAAHAYAAALPPQDVILFCDAFDVLYVDNPGKILTRLDAMNATILFSAECGCWPHIMENHGRACFDNYPLSPTPYRYLNSGAWVGKALNAKNMLFEVIEKAGNNFKNANDQKLVADMFIDGRHNISLDYHAHIFQSMHMTLTPPLSKCDPKDDIIMDDEGKWINTRTNGTPSIIHFNGGGKKYHLGMESVMWYKKKAHNSPEEKRSIQNQLLLAPSNENMGRHVKFKDICPSYFGKF